mmetsp:Transcript_23875/g.60295  ORF Transcript_23875/g.60295 Transcript_23875/m.60295 type:complete len:228 (-) Transcript_23875:1307-1990(-)
MFRLSTSSSTDSGGAFSSDRRVGSAPWLAFENRRAASIHPLFFDGDERSSTNGSVATAAAAPLSASPAAEAFPSPPSASDVGEIFGLSGAPSPVAVDGPPVAPQAPAIPSPSLPCGCPRRTPPRRDFGLARTAGIFCHSAYRRSTSCFHFSASGNQAGSLSFGQRRRMLACDRTAYAIIPRRTFQNIPCMSASILCARRGGIGSGISLVCESIVFRILPRKKEFLCV